MTSFFLYSLSSFPELWLDVCHLHDIVILTLSQSRAYVPKYLSIALGLVARMFSIALRNTTLKLYFVPSWGTVGVQTDKQHKDRK